MLSGWTKLLWQSLLLSPSTPSALNETQREYICALIFAVGAAAPLLFSGSLERPVVLRRIQLMLALLLSCIMFPWMRWCLFLSLTMSPRCIQILCAVARYAISMHLQYCLPHHIYTFIKMLIVIMMILTESFFLASSDLIMTFLPFLRSAFKKQWKLPLFYKALKAMALWGI